MGSMSDTSDINLQVPLDVRLRLEHAALQRIADDAGVRMLHIKGVAWHPALAKGRPPPSDADVLVHPEDVPALTTALEQAGWHLVTSFAHGSVFGHAATYYSPRWGTVDVHRRFPGMDRDTALTFEVLWRDRGIIELGGYPVAVPDLLGQRLLMLTHAARDSMGRRAHDVEAAWSSRSPVEREQVDVLADRLGARVPVAFATGRPERAYGEPGVHLWAAVHHGAYPTSVWVARLRDARGVRERLRVLRSALRVNPDHLALRLGRRPSSWDMRREWLARWVRAGRSLHDHGR